MQQALGNGGAYRLPKCGGYQGSVVGIHAKPRSAPSLRKSCCVWFRLAALTARRGRFRRPHALLAASDEAAPVRRGRQPRMFAKRGRERAGFAEAQIEADLRDRHLRIRQQSFRLFHPKPAHVAVRWQAERLLERPHEVIWAQPRDIGQRCQGRVFGEVVLDILRHSLLLPTGEPAANALYRGGAAVVEPQELVRQHNAERLRILSVPGTGTAGLCLEFLRRVPQVLVEEEEARLELGFGEMQFGSEQGADRIDVEIGHARQDARLVPAAEPVAGRNEAERPAEFVQRGARQPLHQRLALVPYSAPAHDQSYAW